MEDQDLSNDSDEITFDDQLFETNGDLTKKFNRMRNQLQTLIRMDSNVKNCAALKGQILNRISDQKKHAFSKHIESANEGKLRDEPEEALNQKFSSRIKLDANDLFNYKVSSKKEDDGRYLFKDKADRATVEQVLDPRTKMILFKMLNRDIIYEINGCISTGKEANVYHAETSQKENRAIKIYKTSILVFKDRDRYVTGEHRFRHGYSSKNPRKMVMEPIFNDEQVQTWAEKEMRNLKRLHGSGIPCPEPLLLRLHVLLMTFIGDKSGRFLLFIYN